jgi:hypothetical protein
MENPHFMYGVTNLSSGILFILISIPLVLEKIPMNRLYGFRVQKAFSSDENWFKINRYGGSQLIKWSVFLVGIGILNFWFPATETYNAVQNFLYAAGPLCICLFVVTVKTLLYARTLDG